MHILLTNDDSHISPLLRFDILKTCGDVTIVVPQEEQSWTERRCRVSNPCRCPGHACRRTWPIALTGPRRTA
jgi:broad specificity polyphosphatase/5'/3'-nucleotidase SurE